ncbi:unnamed protein product, partial [Choristocarpus tenellus]
MQIAEKDLYGVLGLEQGVDEAGIKSAYHKLARRWHPDKNPDDTETAQRKFAEIAEAYEVLSDDYTRRQYEHARHARVSGAWGGGSAGAGGGERFGGDGGGFDDVFSFGDGFTYYGGGFNFRPQDPFELFE